MRLLSCRLPAQWTLLVVLSLLWGGVPPARCQEIGAGIAENIAAGRSATDFHSRLRVNSAYLSVDRPDDPWLVSTRFSGTYAPHPSVALRLQLPLVYVDPGSSGGTFGTVPATWARVRMPMRAPQWVVNIDGRLCQLGAGRIRTGQG